MSGYRQLLVAYRCCPFSYTVFCSWELNDRTRINLYSFRIRYVIEFAFTSIQGYFEVDTQFFSFFLGILCFQLSNENTLCSLVVDGWCTFAFSEFPGCRSLFCEVEDIEFIRLEYREHTDEFLWSLVGNTYFIFISCAIHPMVERITLVVKGFVRWDDILVTVFHPCSLRRSSFCFISGIVGDVIGILHFLEADLQIAVGGDVEFQFILGTDTVGCKIMSISRLICLCFSENSIIESYHVYRSVIIHLQYGNRFSVLIQLV